MKLYEQLAEHPSRYTASIAGFIEEDLWKVALSIRIDGQARANTYRCGKHCSVERGRALKAKLDSERETALGFVKRPFITALTWSLLKKHGANSPTTPFRARIGP